MILSLGWLFDWFPLDGLTAVTGGLISVLFMLLTTGLLVYDLEKPERFLYILIRPQWNSWLTRGAIFLIGFSTVAGFWLLYELGGLLFDYNVPVVRTIYLIAGFPLAIGVAVYTAFLFAQAEGRDLWQSALLPFHLLVQAFMAGSAVLLVLSLFVSLPSEMSGLIATIFIVTLIVDLFITLAGEFGVPHASEVAAKAAHEISHGRYRNQFWWGSIGIGHVAPLLLVLAAVFLVDSPILGAVAGVCSAVGLYLYEYAFVMAPQEIPNS